MRRVKIVDEAENGEHPEISFQEAANQLMARALADGAVAMMLVWETPGSFKFAAVPYSHAVLRGLSDAAYSDLWIKPEEELEE
jgi:hypothetical protein